MVCIAGCLILLEGNDLLHLLNATYPLFGLRIRVGEI